MRKTRPTTRKQLKQQAARITTANCA